jgi:transcriptional regulator
VYIPAFNRIEDETISWALMREFNFALLVTAPDGVPFATSVPFTILETQRKITTHVARANPQWQHLEAEREALIVFQGEHAFVSPRWYEHAPQVPTWNYATVHAYATPRLLNDTETRAQLEALMAQHAHGEDMAALPETYLEKMQRGIVAVEFSVTRLEGKLKLSQNKSVQDQKTVAARLEAQGELERGLAARMNANLEPDSDPS